MFLIREDFSESSSRDSEPEAEYYDEEEKDNIGQSLLKRHKDNDTIKEESNEGSSFLKTSFKMS